MNIVRKLVFLLLGLLCAGGAHAQFDHGYAGWDALVRKHVRWLPDNKQSRVDYAAFQADRADLKKVLDALAAVPKAEFDGWTPPQRMAFLINAYNAFTVELILTRLAEGRSVDEILSEYPHLSRAQVTAAIEYARSLVARPAEAAE